MQNGSTSRAGFPSQKPRHAAPHTQLALPCSLDQATLLAEHVARLEDKLTEAHERIAALRDENAALRPIATSALEREGIWLQRYHEMRDLWQKASVEAALLRLRAGQARRQHRETPVPSWLDGALKHLLTTAHPDKWSQGQPAAPLAHELAIAVNTLRARLDGEVAR